MYDDIYVKSTTHRGSCFLFRVPIARSPLGSVTLGGKQRTVLFSYTLAPLRYLLLLRLLLRTNLVFNINIKVRPSGRTFCILNDFSTGDNGDRFVLVHLLIIMVDYHNYNIKDLGFTSFRGLFLIKIFRRLRYASHRQRTRSCSSALRFLTGCDKGNNRLRV